MHRISKHEKGETAVEQDVLRMTVTCSIVKHQIERKGYRCVFRDILNL